MSEQVGVWFAIRVTFPDEAFYAKAVPALRKLVASSFVRADLAYVGRPSGTLRELTPSALRRTTGDRSFPTWCLASSTDEAPNVSLRCHRFLDELELELRLRDAAWRSYGSRLAAGIQAMTCAVVDAFGKRARVAGSLVPAFHPQIEVPAALGRGPYDPLAVVAVIDRRTPPGADPARATMRQKILTAPLPASVRVLERGDAVMRFWTDDLGSEKAVRAACRRRQQWLVKTLWT